MTSIRNSHAPHRAAVAVATAVATLFVSACAGEPSTPTPTPTPAFAEGYDSNDQMWAIFTDVSQPPASTVDALRAIREQNDRSLVPVIIEIARLWGNADDRDAMTRTLEQLTGESLGGAAAAWSEWMIWLGQNLDDFQPPNAYVAWKANLLSLIDPRMGAFLTQTPGSERIDLTEVVWGGVPTDGIPDLQNPTPLLPADAAYILPNDRVFGVSINGEHRAYPLRIVNAHEMANDVLGGEPIALTY